VEPTKPVKLHSSKDTLRTKKEREGTSRKLELAQRKDLLKQQQQQRQKQQQQRL
jgi:hypothetical protein